MRRWNGIYNSSSGLRRDGQCNTFGEGKSVEVGDMGMVTQVQILMLVTFEIVE